MSDIYELEGDTTDLTFTTSLKPRIMKRIRWGYDDDIEGNPIDPFKFCTACRDVCKRGFPFWEFYDGCGHCGHKEYNHFRGEGEAP